MTQLRGINSESDLEKRELQQASPLVLVTKKGPPNPVMSGPAVIARSNIGSIEIPLPVNPACHGATATLVAITVLLADDLNLGRNFRAGN